MRAHENELDPHGDTPVLEAGASLAAADGLVILLHGRGGSADDILSLKEVMEPELDGVKLAWLAPAADRHTWYPNSFLAPREQNEPYLSSALAKIEALVQLADESGIGPERIVIGGFSQGACLSTEFVASHPARYGGLIAFTGGLVGPLGTPMSQTGDLGGMPALLLSGDPDPHVPWSRVEESADVLSRMGAEVTLKSYPGKGHTVSRGEIDLGKQLIAQVFSNRSRRIQII